MSNQGLRERLERLRSQRFELHPGALPWRRKANATLTEAIEALTRLQAERDEARAGVKRLIDDFQNAAFGKTRARAETAEKHLALAVEGLREIARGDVVEPANIVVGRWHRLAHDLLSQIDRKEGE